MWTPWEGKAAASIHVNPGGGNPLRAGGPGQGVDGLRRTRQYVQYCIPARLPRGRGRLPPREKVTDT